jgi:hypothetical protein
VKTSLSNHNRLYNPIVSHLPHGSLPSSSPFPSSSASYSSPLSSERGRKESMSSLKPYRFDILISFYEKKEIKEYLGLVTRNENAYFEHWRIPVSIVDFSLFNNPFSSPSSSSSTMDNFNHPQANTVNDFHYHYRIAYDCVSNSIMAIIEVCFSLFPLRSSFICLSFPFPRFSPFRFLWFRR